MMMKGALLLTAAAAVPLTYPTRPEERLVTSIAMNKLGIRGKQATRGKVLDAASTVAQGSYEGLRTKVVYGFDDDNKACPELDLSAKLKQSTANSKGLGERRCPDGTVSLNTYEGLKCAEWHGEGADQYTAVEICNEKGGFLAAPATPEVETKLKEYLRSETTNDTFWAGVQILDPTTSPVQVTFFSQATVTQWNAQWNAPSFSTTGMQCCPNLYNATGNPRCLVYDGWRDLRGLHPYPVTDCSQKHAFFCEINPLTIDSTTGDELQFTTASPHVLYSAQPPHVATFFNRQTGTTYVTNCTSDMVVTKTLRDVLSTELDNALKFIRMTLSPIFRTAGMTGNGRAPYQFLCGHDYLTWDLKENMMKTPGNQYLLPDTDLVIFVTTMPDPYATSWSLPCSFSTDQRPNAILLNVAPSHLRVVSQRKYGSTKLRIRLLQSLLHALGFHENLFHSWKQPVVNKTINSLSCSLTVSTSCRKLAVIVTPAVKAWLNTQQFLCTGNPSGGSGTIEGAELEDANIAPGPPDIVLGYWEKRLFKGEVMTLLPPLTEDFSDTLQVVSGLTLAAFEDMGWYRVNKDMASTLKWGRGQSCKFATGDCTDWPARYKCDGSVTHTNVACSPDFSSLGFCNKVTWPSGTIPSKFVWASGTLFGGADPLMDYCFINEEAQMAYASCLWDSPELPDCQGTPCTTFHVRGPTSRCFETTLRYKNYDTPSTPTARGTCLPHECLLVNSRWMVKLFVGGAMYVCTYKYEVVGPTHASTFGLTTAANYVLLGEITCPDPQELCVEAGPNALQQACDPVDDCNAAGFCRDGKCVCFNSKDFPGPDPANPHIGSRGFFQGANCNKCEEGYFGYPVCKSKKCTADPDTKVMCYGNGACNGVTGLCECFQNMTHGYWDASTSCKTCLSGYTGGSCTAAACITSHDCGKGSCNVATGRCRCFTSSIDGYWGGARCDRCRDGYDIATLCTQRIRSYFACDALLQSDPLTKRPSPMDCTACNIKCGAEGRLSRCATPQRLQETDEFGCLLSPKIPECQGQSIYCKPCPVPTAVLMDCHNYPLLFTTCWVKDECGCSPSFIACAPGTSAALPVSYDPQIFNAQGLEDPRYRALTGSDKQCECKVTLPADIDCWGPTNIDGSEPLYEPGSVVYFDPRRFQIIDEDFCHCTSPPVPSCSDATKPYRLKERTYGTTLNCAQVKRRTGCPEWDRILNVNQAYNASKPDLSIIDCGGWPPPRYSANTDPCDCPLPVFTCKQGSRGVCDTSTCPKWERIELDCKGLQPPVLTLSGKHPCGCPPPPKPICREGTGPCCECDYSVPETIWVDCKGDTLDPPDWDPEIVYPLGNPKIQPCDPCPQCAHPPPVRKCIPGYSVRPASENKISNCKGQLNLDACPVYPPSCPVDCKGSPPPAPTLDDECNCPPPPPPPCLPGTYGPGSVLDFDVAPTPCDSQPAMCGAYACAPGYDLSAIARKLHHGESTFRRCHVKEDVWNAMPSVKYCKQSCVSDLDCACGYKCSVCGICRHRLVPDPAVTNNCLVDKSICGVYGCEYDCRNDIEKIIEDMILDAVCKEKCVTNSDCNNGAVCNKPIYAAPPGAGSGFTGQVKIIGEAQQSDTTQATIGIPGFNVRATRVAVKLADEQADFVPERDYGECVKHVENPVDVIYCYSHNDCNGYACGTSNTQTFFSVSRCRSSCWVNGHCHPDYKCSRTTATCVKIVPSEKTCEDDPNRYLQAYGGCEGMLETANVTCNTDLSVGYGLPVPSFMKYLCPMACDTCVTSAGSVDRGAQVLEACVDDPGGQLASFGSSPLQRCAAVIAALTCDGDIGSLVKGITPGVLVSQLCPNGCGLCTPPEVNPIDQLFGNTSVPDPCGGMNMTLCTEAPGCCFNSEKGTCATCNLFEANPMDHVRPSSTTLPDSPSCDLQPFDYCHPYVCGGVRGAVPPQAAACPTSCATDEGCQPFYRCKQPTLHDLAAKYGVSLKPDIDRTTGALHDTPLFNSFQMLLLSGSSDYLGRCVPTPYINDDTQAEVSLTIQRANNVFHTKPLEYPWSGKVLPMVNVPVAHLRGLQIDPYIAVFQHAPFAPPPLPRPKPIGSVFSSPAECYPYIAASRGLTSDQLHSMTGNLPSCKTSCFDDEDCAGGLICSRVGRKRVYVSVGGNRVVADPSCSSYDGCLGDQEKDAGPPPPEGRGTCQPPRGLGAACTYDTQCGSLHCVDGVCCNTQCDLPCQTCSELGVCGWVMPYTDPHRRCAKCEWCDYEPDDNGEISASSPLACAQVPKGKDPKNVCGVHGACNGEGDCLALNYNWGGRTSDTCALGFSGPDCAHELMSHREILIQEDQRSCSIAEAAYLAGSPDHGKTAAASAYVSQRTPDGFTPVGVQQPTSRLSKVVDLRPRQWVTKVLGVKEHSTFPCSNILYEPEKKKERVHSVSTHSWAPKQYYRNADGTEVNPSLKWNPYFNCYLSEKAPCNAKWNCVWDEQRAYCRVEKDTVVIQGAEAVCMGQYKCFGNNMTSEYCQQMYPNCAVTTNGGPDWSVVTPPPLQWIELSVDVPVYIETVILYENHAPGSLVRIEIQEALTGSAAMAAAGGGNVETNDEGNVVPPRKANITKTRPVINQKEEMCASYTDHGPYFCKRQVGCDWDEVDQKCIAGSRCKVTMAECAVLEQKRVCYWDPSEGLCMDGVPCTPSSNQNSITPKIVDFCNSLNHSTCLQQDTMCVWGLTSKETCNYWTYTDECARFKTIGDCGAQMRGLASKLVQYCSWDPVNETCSERPELYDCTLLQSGALRSEGVCNETLACIWDPVDHLCVVNITDNTTSHFDCSVYTKRSDCIACPFNSESPYCNAQCSWLMTEVQACLPILPEECGMFDYGECVNKPVCTWRGRVDKAARRQAAVKQAVPPSTEGTSTSKNYSVVFSQACYLNTEVVPAQTSSPTVASDYKTYCEGIFNKQECNGAVMWTTGQPFVCTWQENIVIDDETVIPAAPLSRYELASYGGADHPTFFTMAETAPVYSGVQPTKEELGTAPGDVRCEDIPAGKTLNTNTNPWVKVWERQNPNFPLRKRYRETAIDVGSVNMRARNIRLWFSPTSDSLSQVDAVAVVGRNEIHKRCKGYVWASPIPDGVPASAPIQSGSVWAVACSGRGICTPYGCKCLGNFYGEGCEVCAFGWTGPACDMKLTVGCRVVGSEDLSQFRNAEEVLKRWSIVNYRHFVSRASSYEHFGTSLTGPVYDLSDRTHFKAGIGILLIDVPKNEGDCGIRVLASVDKQGTNKEVVYARSCTFFTGLNIIGKENSDLVDYFTVMRRWPHASLVITLETWSGLGASSPFITITDLLVQSCHFAEISNSTAS